MQFKSINVNIAATGLDTPNDIYTCPVGKQALIVSASFRKLSEVLLWLNGTYIHDVNNSTTSNLQIDESVYPLFEKIAIEAGDIFQVGANDSINLLGVVTLIEFDV